MYLNILQIYHNGFNISNNTQAVCVNTEDINQVFLFLKICNIFYQGSVEHFACFSSSKVIKTDVKMTTSKSSIPKKRPGLIHKVSCQISKYFFEPLPLLRQCITKLQQVKVQIRSQRLVSMKKHGYISCTKWLVPIKELCIYNASFMGSLGWQMLLERRGGHRHLTLLLLLDDTAELLLVMATAPDHVCPQQNGSLKVKPLTGAGTIRLHFIAVLRGAAVWPRTRFTLPGGKEINLSLYDGWRK